MIRKPTAHFALSGIALTLAACSAETMTTGTLNSMDTSDSLAADLVSVSVAFSQGEDDESMNLVKASLESYTAKLSGGVACWGDLPETFVGETAVPAKSLKVRKAATGCAVSFTSLKFKGNAATYSLSEGITAKQGETKVFLATGSSVRLRVLTGFTTAAASEIKLAGEFAALETASESIITDGAIAVAASADAVASPHVKVTKVEAFNGKLYVNFECVDATSVNSACKPSLSGAEVQAQPLSAMKARIIQVAGRPTVAETLAQLNYTTMKSQFDAAAGEQSAAEVTGIRAKFNGLPHLTPAAGNRLVLVVAFSEAIGGSTGTGFKAFLLK